jgi:hypothetical protein
MTTSNTGTSTGPTPLTLEERLELANWLYRACHTRCFWHCPRDLVITEELIPLVVRGLLRPQTVSGRGRTWLGPPATS